MAGSSKPASAAAKPPTAGSGGAAAATGQVTAPSTPAPLVPITIRVKHHRTTYFLESLLGSNPPNTVLSLKQSLFGMLNPKGLPSHSVRCAFDGTEVRMPASVSGIRLLLPTATAPPAAAPATKSTIPKANSTVPKESAHKEPVVLTAFTGAPSGSPFAACVHPLNDDTQTLDHLGFKPDQILLAVFEIDGKWDEIDVPRPEPLDGSAPQQ